MATNSLGTLTSTVISAMFLGFLKQRLAPLKAITLDFSDEAIDYGAAVKTRVVTVPSAIDYHVDNGYVAANAATTDYTVTMNKHKHVTLEFNDQELSGTRRNLVLEQAEAQAYALADQMLDDLFALILAATYTNTTITETIANTDRDTLLAQRKSLTNAKVPTSNRHVLGNVDYFTSLSADAKIISLDYGEGKPDMESGIINNLAGFKSIIECPTLPSTENMSAFSLHPSALLLVARLPKDPGQVTSNIPGVIGTITEPDLGLSIQTREWYDMQKGKVVTTFTLMYGVAAGNVAFGTITKTA